MPIFSALGDERLLGLECPSCGKVVLHPAECGDIFCRLCPMRSSSVSCKEHSANKCPECRGTTVDGNMNAMEIGGREIDEYYRAAMDNLCSDEEDEQQPSDSAPSTTGRRRLTLILGRFRDRFRHANPFATPAARWMTLAMILCWNQSLLFKQWCARYEHLSELCREMRREYEVMLSQFHCISKALWLFSSHLDICGFICVPIALGLITRRLRNHGFTTVKIAASYLTVLNLSWLLDEAWAYWTYDQDQQCSAVGV